MTDVGWELVCTPLLIRPSEEQLWSMLSGAPHSRLGVAPKKGQQITHPGHGLFSFVGLFQSPVFLP